MPIGTSDGDYHEDPFDHVMNTGFSAQERINYGFEASNPDAALSNKSNDNPPKSPQDVINQDFNDTAIAVKSGDFDPVGNNYNPILEGKTPVTNAPKEGLTSPALEQARKDLNLNPQEEALYQRHLTNLNGPGGVDNPDGSRSTLYQTSFESNGKTYNVPTVYDGKILTPEAAINRAMKEGLDKFPSYSSSEEAEARYQQMHSYMEKDTAAFMQKRNDGRVPPLGAPIEVKDHPVAEPQDVSKNDVPPEIKKPEFSIAALASKLSEGFSSTQQPVSLQLQTSSKSKVDLTDLEGLIGGLVGKPLPKRLEDMRRSENVEDHRSQTLKDTTETIAGTPEAVNDQVKKYGADAVISHFSQLYNDNPEQVNKNTLNHVLNKVVPDYIKSLDGPESKKDMTSLTHAVTQIAKVQSWKKSVLEFEKSRK